MVARIDTAGRDVTDLAGLWDDTDRFITTIAFQGDIASPATFQRDMGDLADVVDIWMDSKFGSAEIAKALRPYDLMRWLGYSRGGIIVHELLAERLIEPNRVDRAIVYEAPNLTRCKLIPGFFPVGIAWNDQSKSKRRWRLCDATARAWSWQHPIRLFFGSGRHIRKVPNGHPPFGHNWDWSLNDRFRRFLNGETFDAMDNV